MAIRDAPAVFLTQTTLKILLKIQFVLEHMFSYLMRLFLFLRRLFRLDRFGLGRLFRGLRWLNGLDFPFQMGDFPLQDASGVASQFDRDMIRPILRSAFLAFRGEAIVLVPAAIDVFVAIEDLFIEAFMRAADIVALVIVREIGRAS